MELPWLKGFQARQSCQGAAAADGAAPSSRMASSEPTAPTATPGTASRSRQVRRSRLRERTSRQAARTRKSDGEPQHPRHGVDGEAEAQQHQHQRDGGDGPAQAQRQEGGHAGEAVHGEGQQQAQLRRVGEAEREELGRVLGRRPWPTARRRSGRDRRSPSTSDRRRDDGAEEQVGADREQHERDRPGLAVDEPAAPHKAATITARSRMVDMEGWSARSSASAATAAMPMKQKR